MNLQSFNADLSFNEQKASTKVILETSFTKEIRILLKKGQTMKEHRAPHPIVIHILQGEIEFGVENQVHVLNHGSICTLEENIPHNLKALKDSIVRLTLSKLDSPTRVEKAI